VPSALGEDCFGVPTGVEYGQQPNLRRTDYVKQAVRKAVEIQAAHIRKADGIKFCIVNKLTKVRTKISGKSQSQARLLVFVPVDGVPEISADQRMS
jgi:hypothetical protein